MSARKPFLSSGEVVERLGISKATLYAYVSRGLIRSEPVPDSPRSRRYRADDVEQLLQRQRMRTDPEVSAATALDWGTPVLESSISFIADERLYYRGHDAVELAREATFEQVAALLWYDDLSAPLPQPTGKAREFRQAPRNDFDQLDPLSHLQSLLPLIEAKERGAYDVRPESILRMGMDILDLFVEALVGEKDQRGIARTLQKQWAPDRLELVPLLDAALILSADHELNISTFTVRCIASAGAPVHSAIAGGLGAIRGSRHGGSTLQAEALIDEVATPDRAYDTLRLRLQRGDSLAGFGHQLYPSSDPRGEAIIAMMNERIANSTVVSLVNSITGAAEDLVGARPNVDFALVALSKELGLPNGSARALMALGRMAGWIAHASEEYARGRLIRPRARYAGRPPYVSGITE